MTVRDAARSLELSVQQVYKLIKLGRLPHSRYGEEEGKGPIRISDEDLEAFRKSCRVERPITTLQGLKHIKL